MAFKASKPTVEEEDAFMRDLFDGIDDSFWKSSLTPDPSPAKTASASNQPLGPSKSTIETPVRKRPRSTHTTPLHRSVKKPRLEKRSATENIDPKLGIDIGMLLEGVEDWDWDDMLSPVKPKKVTPSTSTTVKTYEPTPCTRCTVQLVKDSIENGRPAKTLHLQTEPSGEARIAILRDDWLELDVRLGDVVNILGHFDAQQPPTIYINTSSGLLVQHPDILLTATAVSNALQCRRKPLLSSLVRSSTNMTPALVWGNMLHEVMQICWRDQHWEEDWVEKRIDEVIRRNLSDLVMIGFSVEQAKAEMRQRAKGIQPFQTRYLGVTPKDDAILTNTRTKDNEKVTLAISKLHDIEEDISSPRYGLKGKIDASVQAIIRERGPFGTSVHEQPMPFEIKTGRAVGGMEHRAQTMLYTFMMAERYCEDVPAGLLYYTQSDEVIQVPVGRHEVRGLICARNEMAGYLMRREEHSKKLEKLSFRSKMEEATAEVVEKDASDIEAVLPASIDDERTCKRCYAVDTCMLYRKAVEGDNAVGSTVADIFDMKTSHLSDAHCAFFKKWEALIAMEEHDMLRFKKELWTMTAVQREARNRCFADMILLQPKHNSEIMKAWGRSDRINQYTYTFTKATPSSSVSPSLLSGHMNVGDAILISAEPNLFALCRGFIAELLPDSVTVNVDHVIEEDTIRARLFKEASARVVFRLDKDELSSGLARVRENLAQLFYVHGDHRRRELVVDLQAPQFDEDPVRIAEVDSVLPDKLNERQRVAMHKVFAARDYALILGMPGTGKTTTIAELIKLMVDRGKTVLLASYTHSAVDTILLKLKDAEFEILRVGNVDKVHPEARCFTLEARTAASSTEQLESQLLTPPVVATTCLSLDNALFSRRTFDYCILDEASQVTLPTCLGPLRFAHRFVLVGDHFQLPPLVRSGAARNGGFDHSLFKRLTEAHPEAAVDLNEQYRMNEDIMLLSNKLIYGDRLKCGSSAVAKQALDIPQKSFLDSLHKPVGGTCASERCWIKSLLDPKCKAVFVDTDAVPGHDSRVGDLVQNDVEATIVQQVTESLLRSGIKPEQIGILSLYRQQIKLLMHKLRGHSSVEILTADRSQGRDKDCVIISMVRSNSDGQVGELLRDWRRLNVSFTRARSKLVIIGSRSTLNSLPLFAQFFELMLPRGWIVTLPKDAHLMHADAFASASDADDVNSAPAGKIVGVKKENPKVQPKVVKTGSVKAEGVLKGRPIRALYHIAMTVLAWPNRVWSSD